MLNVQFSGLTLLVLRKHQEEIPAFKKLSSSKPKQLPVDTLGTET